MYSNQANIVPLNSGMYQYEIPLKPPSDEKELLNFNIPKKDDQYWRTPFIPNVKHMTVKDRIFHIERERQRWEEGVYVLINGELTYLTGMFYDHLTYMTFKDKKAEYFDHQRFDFYFRDLTIRDKKCRGRVWMKPRRYGATMQEITESTYHLLSDFSNNVGLQSDTPKKVRTTLMGPIINSFVKRPRWMRSDYYKPNGKLLVSEINLNTNLAPDDDGNDKGDYLLGWCKEFPSLPRSMDGNEMIYIVMDEVWKWVLASPKETLESNIKVLMGRNRAGIVSMLSTFGDSDDYLRAILDGIDIIARSNPKIRDENGQTLSGLFEYFVNALFSFDIPPDIFEVNKFGKVNQDKHLTYIKNKLSKLDKKSKAYVFESRRLPLTKADALMSAQMVTYFRKVILNARLQELMGMTPDQKPYVRGHLREHPTTGKIFFEAASDGIWLIAVHPYFSADKNIDTRNRFRKDGNGVFWPPINPEFCIGYDPVRYNKEDIQSSHYSRAAAIVHKKFDYFGSGVQDVKAALMLYRPDDARDADKEVIKACKYFGCECMHERLIEGVKESFVTANCLPMLMKNEKNPTEYGVWTDSGGKIVKNGLDMMVSRYSAPKDEKEVDQLATYPFEDGLIDMDNVDLANTTAFDVFMCEIMLEFGLKQMKLTNLTDNKIKTLFQYMQEIMAPVN